MAATAAAAVAADVAALISTAYVVDATFVAVSAGNPPCLPALKAVYTAFSIVATISCS